MRGGEGGLYELLPVQEVMQSKAFTGSYVVVIGQPGSSSKVPNFIRFLPLEGVHRVQLPQANKSRARQNGREGGRRRFLTSHQPLPSGPRPLVRVIFSITFE